MKVMSFIKLLPVVIVHVLYYIAFRKKSPVECWKPDFGQIKAKM